MKKKINFILLTTLLVFITHNAYSGDMKDKLGYGFNIGGQKVYCDVLHTGVGPGMEAYLKYLVSDRFNMTCSFGFGELNDGLLKNTFRTNLITGDLKGHLCLTQPGSVIPYISLGLGIFNFQYENEPRYFDGSFILGGGLEIVLKPRVSLEASMDYRHTTGDELDGVYGGAKDGYLQGRIGLTFYLNDRISPQRRDELEDDLIAMDEEDLSNLFADDESPDTSRFADFEQKLNKLEESESEFAMEQYLAYKSKIDELNTNIALKEREIENLETELDFKRDRISELEDQLQQRSVPTYALQQQPASGAAIAFASLYEDGLRNFYGRQYAAAIETFQMLLLENPTHKLTSNCQYWIGESYFGLGDYYNAKESFNKVFDYELSFKKDDATLMLGRCYIKLGDQDKARLMLESLINNYPDSEYVGKAEQHLNSLKG